MTVQYAWRGDDQYYSTVAERYYRQLPFIFRLRSQAFLLGAIVAFLGIAGNADTQSRIGWALVAAAVAWFFPYVIRRAFVLKYRLRPTFGAEAGLTMGEDAVVIVGPGACRFPWKLYDRAVRYADGIMLITPGMARWLPDAALIEGTPTDATAMVRSRLPLRDIQ